MSASERSGPPIARREYLGYAVGDTASCLFFQTFSTFLLIFYTDTFGLAPAVVSGMFLVTRIWDAITDPIMGMIADRTETRHGKFRPWILWGIVPFVASGVLVFVTPDFSTQGKTIYAYVTYSVVMMAYTMVNVPYGALLGVISAKSEERTLLASCRFAGAFVGNLVVLGALLYLVRWLGGGDDRLGYPLAMTVLALMAGALFYFTFTSTTERIRPPPTSGAIGRDLGDLLRNRPWIVLSLASLVTLVSLSVRNGAMLYYFKYFLRDETAAPPFLTTGAVFSMAGTMLTPAIVRRLGGDKRLAFVVLTVLSAAALAPLYFIGPGQWTLLYGCHIAFSVPSAAMFPLIWSMYADTADHGERLFGRRATGLVFSAATFAQKMGWAAGSALAGYLLARAGFVANAAQSGETLAAIRHMMSTLPAALAVAAGVIVACYRLRTPTGESAAPPAG